MARLLNTDDTVLKTVPGAETWNAGDLRLTDCGRVGIKVGGVPAVAGEKASLRIRGFIEAPAGANLSAGAVVAAHIANQNIVAQGAGGSTVAGILLHTVTSGQMAIVDLNAQDLIV